MNGDQKAQMCGKPCTGPSLTKSSIAFSSVVTPGTLYMVSPNTPVPNVHTHVIQDLVRKSLHTRRVFNNEEYRAIRAIQLHTRPLLLTHFSVRVVFQHLLYLLQV